MNKRAFFFGALTSFIALSIIFLLFSWDQGIGLVISASVDTEGTLFLVHSSFVGASCLAAFTPFPKARSVFREGALVIEAPDPTYRDRVYLDVSLEKQLITLFDNGEARAVYRIAAMGNPRYSPTPKGEFKVLHKQENHFSSIAKVWMPWSIRFYGNYFIHGIPYYPGGKLYTGRYSAGCVRVPTDQQEDLYQKIAIGTLVVVH